MMGSCNLWSVPFKICDNKNAADYFLVQQHGFCYDCMILFRRIHRNSIYKWHIETKLYFL